MNQENHDFDVPATLSPEAKNAARLILKQVQATFGQGANGGGCRAFYAPEEWKARGEKYGCKSLLVIVYDGGDMYNVFGHPEFGWDLREKVEVELEKIGLYMEACTHWYSAVYPIS